MAGGAEVGSGHVSIFPVMTGFRSLVNKEVQASGKQGAGLFSKAFDGKKIGGDLGKDLSRGVDAQTKDLGTAGFQQLAKEAGKAAGQVAQARQKQSAAADAVRAAEQKLADAIAKGGEDSAAAITAASKLAAAQEKEEQAADNLREATDKLKESRQKALDVAASSGDSGLEWLKTETENAATAVELSRKRMVDANKSVETAEAKMRAAVEKFGPSSTQAITAQSKLIAAKQRQESASQKLEDAEDRLRGAQNQLETATKQAGDALEKESNSGSIFAKGLDVAKNAVDGLKDKLSDFAGSIGGLASAVGIGAGLGKAIESGLEQANLQGTLKAMVGNEADARMMGNVVGRIYADGWGESLDEVTEAVSRTKQALKNVNEADLETVTRNALTLSDVFDSDINENVRGINALMDGFGISATHATDLLTAGMQNGLNYSDELADNLAEYAGRWGEAGMSAEEYFSLLQTGADNGAYQLDKVGDFLNESLTSLTDGRVYEILGLFSDETTRLFTSFQHGGAKAGDVLKSIIKDLNENENSAERAMIMSELWGSLGEDNAQKMILAMGNVKNAYSDVDGAAQKAAENNQSIETTWTQFTRKISTAVGSELIPVIQSASDMVPEHGEDIGRTIGDLAGLVSDLVGVFVGLPGPVQGAIAGVALFGGKIGGLLSTTGEVAGGIGKIGGKIGDFVKDAGLMSKAGELAKTAIGGIGGAFKGLLGLISAHPIIAVITVIVAGLTWFFTQTEIGRKVWKAFTDWLVDAFKAVGEFFQNLGKNIGDWFTNAAETVQNAWNGIGEWFVGVGEGISEFWQGVVDTVTQTLQSLGESISGIWQGVTDTVSSAFQGLAETIGAAWQAVYDFVSPIVQAIATFIRDVFVVLAAVLVTIWRAITGAIEIAWNAIVAFLTPIVQGIADFIQNTFNTVKTFWENVWNAISTFLQNTWNAIKAFLEPIVQAISTYIQNTLAHLQTVWQNIWNAIKNVATTVWNTIKTFISNTVNTVKTTVTNVINAIKATWENIWNAVKNFVQPIWEGIKTFVSNGINAARNTIKTVLDTIKATWENVWNSVKTFVSRIWDGIKQAVSNGIRSVSDTVGRIKDTVLNAVSGAGRWLYDAGQNIIQGLIDGIGGAFGWLRDKITSLGSNVVSWAEGVLGIHSPSRVFRDRVGRMIGAGMALGIDDSSNRVETSMRRLANDVADTPLTVDTATNPIDAAQQTAGMTGMDAKAFADAMVTALQQAGGFKLNIDLRTFAMMITPMVSSEQGRAQVLG